jgi:hypothetical protein
MKLKFVFDIYQEIDAFQSSPDVLIMLYLVLHRLISRYSMHGGREEMVDYSSFF